MTEKKMDIVARGFHGKWIKVKIFQKLFFIQAFLDFRGFRFTAVYNSILISSPLVLLSNLDLCGLCCLGFSFGFPH